MSTLRLKAFQKIPLEELLTREQREKLAPRQSQSDSDAFFNLSPDEKNVLACLRYARREIDLQTLTLGVWIRTGRTLEEHQAVAAVRSLEDRGHIMQPIPGIFRAMGDKFIHKAAQK